MKLKTTNLACVLGITLASTGVHAQQQWSDFSISYLNGTDYELGDEDRQYFTFEHASGHDWGDTFFFIDREMGENDTDSLYFEFSPRLSLGHLTGKDLSFGPVKDVLIAGTWEGGDGFDNVMAGIGVALDIPGFQYANANLYRVKNENWDDDTMVTLTWGAPFKLGSAEFLYDGFVDWSASSDTNNEEINFTSQLKWNAGKLIGTTSPFYVGIEYAHWTNKFGTKVDERSPSLLLKWHF